MAETEKNAASGHGKDSLGLKEILNSWDGADLDQKIEYTYKLYAFAAFFGEAGNESDEEDAAFRKSFKNMVDGKASEAIIDCLFGDKGGAALDIFETRWRYTDDPTNPVMLSLFDLINTACNIVRSEEKVTVIGKERDRLDRMEALAKRLAGSPVRFVGNVIALLLAAAGIWALWTVPQITALLTAYGFVVIIVFALLVFLLVWFLTSFKAAASSIGALAILSLLFISNIPEEELLVLMMPVSKGLISLVTALVFLPLWVISFRKNLRALVHIRTRASDRADFDYDLENAKMSVALMLSRVEACSARMRTRDEYLMAALRKATSTKGGETGQQVSDDGVVAFWETVLDAIRTYYRYIDAEISRIAKKVY